MNEQIPDLTYTPRYLRECNPYDYILIPAKCGDQVIDVPAQVWLRGHSEDDPYGESEEVTPDLADGKLPLFFPDEEYTIPVYLGYPPGERIRHFPQSTKVKWLFAQENEGFTLMHLLAALARGQLLNLEEVK